PPVGREGDGFGYLQMPEKFANQFSGPHVPELDRLAASRQDRPVGRQGDRMGAVLLVGEFLSKLARLRVPKLHRFVEEVARAARIRTERPAVGAEGEGCEQPMAGVAGGGCGLRSRGLAGPQQPARPYFPETRCAMSFATGEQGTIGGEGEGGRTSGM